MKYLKARVEGTLLARLYEAIERNAPKMRAVPISLLLMDLRDLNAPLESTTTLVRVLEAMERMAPEMSVSDTTLALLGVSHLGLRVEDPVIKRLLEAVERTAPDMSESNAWTVLHELKVLGVRLDGTLLARMVELLNRLNLSPELLKEMIGSVGEDFGAFSVHYHDGTSLIEIERQLYTHSIPERGVVYHHLPSQTLGTCYIYAALNVVLNETVFVMGMMAYMKSELDRSVFGRKPSESSADADQRRFGRRVAARITMSEDLGDVDDDAMSQVFDSISSNKEIFMWARNVILYHTLKASLDDQVRVAGKPFASRTSIFMKDWSLDRDVQGKFEAALDQIGSGGNWVDVLDDIFSLSGLKTRMVGQSLLATVPRSGETLCIGKRPGETARVDGAYTGLMRMQFAKGGHINAFIRNSARSDPLVIESNTGSTQTLANNLEWWSKLGDTCVSQVWTSAFTCIRKDARGRTRGGNGSVGTQSAPTTSERDAALAAVQGAVLVPGDASALASCDLSKSTCELDADLKAALFTIKAFVAHESSAPATGGRGGGVSQDAPWPYTLLALSAITATLSAFA
jgi:hypothetical protein